MSSSQIFLGRWWSKVPVRPHRCRMWANKSHWPPAMAAMAEAQGSTPVMCRLYRYMSICMSVYIYIYIGMIMVALTLLGFHGDFLVATTWWIFWCVNWPWYTTRVFWWFFRGNNPWHLDIEMIMVALRLHGLEAGTEPERSGSGAGTKRIRWFQCFFTVFHGFLACRFAPASLPLHSRFFSRVF